MRNILKTTAAGAAVGGSLLFTRTGHRERTAGDLQPTAWSTCRSARSGVLKDVKAVDAAPIAAALSATWRSTR